MIDGIQRPSLEGDDRSNCASGAIPESMGGALIASTGSCAAIGCQSDVDGETEITLGPTQEIDPGGASGASGREGRE
jgi:hypothetical protein